MAIGSDLKSGLLKLSGRAMERLLADERRAARVARAVGTVQRGKKSLDDAQDDLLGAMGFASRRDWRELGKRVSALKRRLRAIGARLDALS